MLNWSAMARLQMGMTWVAPSGEGGERAIRLAIATIDGPVDYINAHGTSTPAGDPPEIAAIRRGIRG